LVLAVSESMNILKTKYANVVMVLILSAFLAITMIPTSAYAGSAGRKNTAIGLGAVAAYELIKGHTTAGLVLGAGTVYAAHRYNQVKSQENKAKAYKAAHKNTHKAAYRTVGHRVSVIRYTPAGRKYTAYKTVYKRQRV